MEASVDSATIGWQTLREILAKVVAQDRAMPIIYSSCKPARV
jgi:hypothetical protein